jgi:protein TonB
MTPRRILTLLLLCTVAFPLFGKERVYKVGGAVKAPVAVSRPEVDYTPCKLKGKHLSGSPIAELIVGSNGRVSEVRLLKGVEPCLDRQFISSLRAWRFRPAMLDGHPVAVQMNFTLLIHYR